MSNTELESLLLKYMAVESTTGNEGQFMIYDNEHRGIPGDFAEVVANDLEAAGWEVKRQPLVSNPRRVNILATRGTAGTWPHCPVNKGHREEIDVQHPSGHGSALHPPLPRRDEHLRTRQQRCQR